MTSGPPSVIPLTISSPAPNSITPSATTTVSGTTVPGAKVDISASQPGSQDNATSVTETVANGHGDYRASIPTPPGRP